VQDACRVYCCPIKDRGVYSSIIPPWGGGKESKGLRAREENQRRVEKMERQREKKRKISVGNS
jgi:hypothetical protein